MERSVEENKNPASTLTEGSRLRKRDVVFLHRLHLLNEVACVLSLKTKPAFDGRVRGGARRCFPHVPPCDDTVAGKLAWKKCATRVGGRSRNPRAEKKTGFESWRSRPRAEIQTGFESWNVKVAQELPRLREKFNSRSVQSRSVNERGSRVPEAVNENGRVNALHTALRVAT